MKLLQTDLSFNAIVAKAAPNIFANEFAPTEGTALAAIALDYGYK
jgi:hypothetical protein